MLYVLFRRLLFFPFLYCSFLLVLPCIYLDIDFPTSSLQLQLLLLLSVTFTFAILTTLSLARFSSYSTCSFPPVPYYFPSLIPRYFPYYQYLSQHLPDLSRFCDAEPYPFCDLKAFVFGFSF